MAAWPAQLGLTHEALSAQHPACKHSSSRAAAAFVGSHHDATATHRSASTAHKHQATGPRRTVLHMLATEKDGVLQHTCAFSTAHRNLRCCMCNCRLLAMPAQPQDAASLHHCTHLRRGQSRKLSTTVLRPHSCPLILPSPLLPPIAQSLHSCRQNSAQSCQHSQQDEHSASVFVSKCSAMSTARLPCWAVQVFVCSLPAHACTARSDRLNSSPCPVQIASPAPHQIARVNLLCACVWLHTCGHVNTPRA